MIVSGRWFTCVDDLLTKEVCDKLIEALDTGDALEKVERGEMATYNRNILIHEDFAGELYRAIKDILPIEVATTCCNDHFRFSKYDVGQEFKQHRDGINVDGKGGRAKYTVNIFLNDDFEGGATEFFNDAGESVFLAIPKAGRAMIFDNQIIHAGHKVLAGNKYLIRTDVMSTGLD